mmetsp:Transcript_77326/g.250201  ORF Transcript_77326/g.250201 Transcript_77326/m.250201 type:complete len:224 (+) Transcript_77326:280-951(+)
MLAPPIPTATEGDLATAAGGGSAASSATHAALCGQRTQGGHRRGRQQEHRWRVALTRSPQARGRLGVRRGPDDARPLAPRGAGLACNIIRRAGRAADCWVLLGVRRRGPGGGAACCGADEVKVLREAEDPGLRGGRAEDQLEDAVLKPRLLLLELEVALVQLELELSTPSQARSKLGILAVDLHDSPIEYDHDLNVVMSHSRTLDPDEARCGMFGGLVVNGQG